MIICHRLSSLTALPAFPCHVFGCRLVTMDTMREALRNIWRRKARSALTIFGVSIGVFALTTMGALALFFNESLETTLDYYSRRVSVTSTGAGAAGSGSFGAIGGQIPASLAERIKVVDGVAAAYPSIVLPSTEEEHVSGFNQPELIYATRPADAAKDPKKLKVAQGRELQESDRGKVVVGSNIVATKQAKVGQTTKVRGRDFEVVGVLERTNGTPDAFYLMHLDDAQPFVRSLSPFNAGAGDLVTNIEVIPKEGQSGDELAGRLKDTIAGISATPPETFKKQVNQSFQVFNLIILGSALIAVLVGGLSVINTMVMSVYERRKEIGIKRVVGARGRHILSEIVTETALMSLIGGLIGCLLGFVLTTVINSVTRDSGLTIFAFKPLLVLISLAFALILGIMAGLYPAWRASRIKPVTVLRGE